MARTKMPAPFLRARLKPESTRVVDAHRRTRLKPRLTESLPTLEEHDRMIGGRLLSAVDVVAVARCGRTALNDQPQLVTAIAKQNENFWMCKIVDWLIVDL